MPDINKYPKYWLSKKDTFQILGEVLYKIVPTRDIPDVPMMTGGYIKSYKNVPQDDNSWITDDVYICDKNSYIKGKVLVDGRGSGGITIVRDSILESPKSSKNGIYIRVYSGGTGFIYNTRIINKSSSGNIVIKTHYIHTDKSLISNEGNGGCVFDTIDSKVHLESSRLIFKGSGQVVFETGLYIEDMEITFNFNKKIYIYSNELPVYKLNPRIFKKSVYSYKNTNSSILVITDEDENIKNLIKFGYLDLKKLTILDKD